MCIPFLKFPLKFLHRLVYLSSFTMAIDWKRPKGEMSGLVC